MTLRRVLVLAAAGLALLAGGAGVGLWAVLRPLGPGAPVVVVEVPRGAGLGAIARQLEEAGAVRSALGFRLAAHWRGQAGRLRAGEYELDPARSAVAIAGQLAEGRVMTHRISLPEGLRAEEIAARLQAAGLVDAPAFLAVVHDPSAVAELGVQGASLEGYLFPETYQLARGLPPREIARAMVGEFLAVWREIEPAARARGMDMAQVVTLASIIEKETGAPGERPLISAVFHNRLRRGMRLETDPTVIYGIADFDGNLRRADLEDEKNPYNTYRISGLPPGPIANPGADSLRAAVEPAPVDYLFFVSRNDGSHQFSKTLAEHARAVDRYQRRRR